jgi:hypothetical protein
MFCQAVPHQNVGDPASGNSPQQMGDIIHLVLLSFRNFFVCEFALANRSLAMLVCIFYSKFPCFEAGVLFEFVIILVIAIAIAVSGIILCRSLSVSKRIG